MTKKNPLEKREIKVDKEIIDESGNCEMSSKNSISLNSIDLGIDIFNTSNTFEVFSFGNSGNSTISVKGLTNVKMYVERKCQVSV